MMAKELTTGRGASEVNQEAITGTVLEALSNSEEIRRLLTVVSLEGPAGAASSRSISRSDGKLSMIALSAFK